MKKIFLPILFVLIISAPSAFAFDFSGNGTIETAYDSNIEGETDHTVGEEAGNPSSDYLTIASVFLNLQGDKKNKIHYSLSLNETAKFYFDEYKENTNRHTVDLNVSIPLISKLSFNIDNRAIFHFQPKEDIRNFFNNFVSFSFGYNISDKDSVFLGYMNTVKKYPNNNKWNFMKNSFFVQATHRFSDSFWLTADYEGILYRGRNNFYYEKEEEEEEEDISGIFDKKTAKGNEHRFHFSANKIFDGGSALSLKYRFTANSVNDIIDVEEDRELAEFEGPFAYENDEQDFNYTLNEASLIFSLPIMERVSFDVILLYQFQNFDGDAFLLEDKRARRLDRLAVADVSLTFEITDNLEFKIRNAVMHNESNYPEREYERIYTSISFSYLF